MLWIALGVGRQRLLQQIGESESIDDQPTLLVAEDAVHASDGFHQSVAAHRLVGVHRVQAGGGEAGQPHVADDHDAERGFASLKRVASVLRPAPSSALTVN